MGQIVYKVLWIDDEDSIFVGYQMRADKYSIQLDRYSNWEEAEKALKSRLSELFCGYS